MHLIRTAATFMRTSTGAAPPAAPARTVAVTGAALSARLAAIARAGLSAIAAVLAAAALLAAAPAAWAAKWDSSYFPDVPLVSQTGDSFRFYDDLVAGKIVVINFIYTECPDICGLSTARLAQIADWLGDRVGKDIFIYSISLDPATDTPEKLKGFADAFGAGPGWLFLTGKPDEVAQVRYKLGERSESLGTHRNDMVLGNGSTGEWRRASLMGSLQTATREILEMDPAWIAPTPSVNSAGEVGFEIDNRTGESLFLQGCASCHTIGNGVRFGPDLAGVLLRRDRGWLERFLAAPDAVRAAGDPVAVALDAKFPTIRMPDLGLGSNDIADILSYLQSEMDRLESPPEDALPAEFAGQAPAGHTHGGHDHAGHTDSGHDQAGHDHGGHDHAAMNDAAMQHMQTQDHPVVEN